MAANSHNIASLADRLANLSEAYKADVAAVMEDAEQAEVDKTGLRRLVSWRNKDAIKRAEQEAIDEQYRFLAGERDKPASVPRGGELAVAIQLFGEHKTVRDVAKTMGVSVGKAQKLKTLAAAFAGAVHVHLNVNAAAVEMTDADLGTAEPVREMVADDIGDPLLLVDKPRAEFKARVRAIAASVKVAPSPVGPVLTDAPPAEIPDPPPFLDRRVSA
jgi:uncharacterized protein (UPF0335 family)